MATPRHDLPRELVADHLHTDLLAHLEPKVANEVLIDPWLEFTHPIRDPFVSFRATKSIARVSTHQSVVFCSPPGPA